MCCQTNIALRPTLAAGLAMSFLLSSAATSVGGPLVEGCRTPTPPACAADGACRPRRLTWGYYKQNWRRWPEGIPTMAPPITPDTPQPAVPERLPPEISPFETPPPEREDRQAPVQIEKPKRAAPPQLQPPAQPEEAAGEAGGGAAPLPDATGTTPPATSAPTKPFNMPLFDPQPPAQTPFSMPTLDEPANAPDTRISPPLDLDPESPAVIPTTPLPNQFNDNDAPPALPWSLTKGLNPAGSSPPKQSPSRPQSPRTQRNRLDRQAKAAPARASKPVPATRSENETTLRVTGGQTTTRSAGTTTAFAEQPTVERESSAAPKRVSRNLRRIRRALYMAPETAPPPLPGDRR